MLFVRRHIHSSIFEILYFRPSLFSVAGDWMGASTLGPYTYVRMGIQSDSDAVSSSLY